MPPPLPRHRPTLVLVLTMLATSAAADTFHLESSAFAHERAIPKRFTCQGDDVSPPLSWVHPPSGTRSFVLIVDDPDAPDPAAPKMTWVHWVLYDLPVDTSSLPTDVDSSTLPAGTRYGLNDWKRSDYGGPCPPIGRHRYVHTLYALDTTLGDLGHATKATVETAMRSHVLAKAVLIGTYQKR